MRCNFPQHHSAGETGTGGGAWWPLGAAVVVAALFASVITAIIHIVAIALTFIGIAAVVSGAAWGWWRVSHRPQRQIPVQYQPQMTAPRWGRPGLPQQPPAVEQGGQHLHLHLGGLSAAERADVMRQIRGR